MKKFIPLLGLISTILSACSGSDTATPDDSKTITRIDFESSEGWMPTTQALTREQAHSGKFSTKVDGSTEFSMGYSNLLGRMSPARLRKIKLQAWVYLVSDKSQARLGIQIVDPVTGKEVFGDGITLTDQVKSYKKWTEVSKEITLPENITATQTMKLFLWRGSASTAAFMDDVQVSIIE
jgi:hypothetical protein